VKPSSQRRQTLKKLEKLVSILSFPNSPNFWENQVDVPPAATKTPKDQSSLKTQKYRKA
jgi:hypothetical protein